MSHLMLSAFILLIIKTMSEPTTKVVTTYTEKMKRRFNTARQELGKNWKRRMAMAYARYNTLDGGTQLQRVQTGAREHGSIGIDTLEKVTRDMEQLIDDLKKSELLKV